MVIFQFELPEGGWNIWSQGPSAASLAVDMIRLQE